VLARTPAATLWRLLIDTSLHQNKAMLTCISIMQLAGSASDTTAVCSDESVLSSGSSRAGRQVVRRQLLLC